jgi:uncharacterized membrane protein YdjX (TVP38/TMEM64 family)
MDPGGTPDKRGIVARTALAVLIVLACLAAWWFGARDYLTFEALQTQRSNLGVFVASHPLLAYGVYLSAYVVVTMLALPGAAWVTILGGYLFGLAQGAMATVVGATLCARGCFARARQPFPWPR